MDKTWISCCYISIILLFIISCNKNDSIKIENIDESKKSVLSYVASYKIDKDSPLRYTFDFISEDNINFYASNPFSRSIYITQRPYNFIKQIGRNGKGPFEYLTPNRLYIYDKKLYFSDVSSAFLKYIYLNSNSYKTPVAKDYLIKAAKKFCVDNKYIYTLNSFFNPKLNLYDINGGNLLDTLITLPEVYNKINKHIDGGNIVLGPENKIFFSCVAPYIVYVVSVYNNKLVLKEKWNFENEKEISPWTKQNHESLKKSRNRTKILRILHSSTRVSDLKIIGNKDKKYLFSYLTHGQPQGSEIHYYHIISFEGKILKKYKSDSYKLIGVSGCSVFFSKYDPVNKIYSIEEYIFNEKYL